MTQDRQPPQIHPTAEIEDGVRIGDRTAVWAHVHARSGAVVGADCIIGEKTYLAGGVVVGNRVKVNALAYLCEGVTLEDGVMVAAGVVFTNDRNPRAAENDLSALRPSESDERTLTTLVRRGATIGAGSVVGSGLEIGEFAMVGMGSVVTRSVAPHSLVVGNPARARGWVCRCGAVLFRQAVGAVPPPGTTTCVDCGWVGHFDSTALTVTSPE